MNQGQDLATLPDHKSLKQLGLTEADLPRIAEAAKPLADIRPANLHRYGGEAATRTTGFSTRLLDKVRNTDLDASGDKLGEVVKIARGLNLDAFANRSKLPIIGPLIDKLKASRDDLIQKYSTTNAQIDQLMREVGQTQARQSERVREYEQMHEIVREEHRELGIHVAAGRQRLTELHAELSALDGQDDPESRMRRGELDTALRVLDKRVSDLHLLQHATEQTLPMIRLIQANALQLIEKFGAVRDITLPMWRNQFAIQLSLADQKNAVRLADAIDEASNELMRRNAELMHQTSVDTARANQRGVLDIETLRMVNDKLIQTVEEVRQIHREGMAQRRQASEEIDRMREDVQKRLAATAADPA
ncbi:toxic anion resistance protein [Lysobacter pythonis]|uniref:Toxic anion resistance protein n=1 Tax=Solilutibacter pythonis TaxID=2483112 RepID=A0A3M2HUR5_9GAMM|nr:toxic anion resistance protein [Lysobacter pythonis]RMH91149.1 toxic anion resistance protein [Lysobacter pythonis]